MLLMIIVCVLSTVAQIQYIHEDHMSDLAINSSAIVVCAIVIISS